MIIYLDFLIADPINSEDNIVNKISNSKVDAKLAKSKSQDKSKGKNSIKFF